MDKSKDSLESMDWEAEISRLQAARNEAARSMRQAETPEDKKKWADQYSTLGAKISSAEQHLSRAIEAGKPIQLDLFPDWQDGNAAMPNTIARSALFAPINRGRRKFVNNEQVASRADVTIYYKGDQLDMGDADVFAQTIRLIEKFDLGTDVEILPYGFLRGMGRPTGGSAKKWLDKSFERLTEGTLKVDTKEYKVVLHLIDEYFYDKVRDKHFVRVNKKVAELFKKERYGLFDWEKRKQIGLGLTKWMQTYIRSNSGPQRVGIERLQEWCGKKNRQKSKFRADLKETFKELERLGLVKPGWSVDWVVEYEAL